MDGFPGAVVFRVPWPPAAVPPGAVVSACCGLPGAVALSPKRCPGFARAKRDKSLLSAGFGRIRIPHVLIRPERNPAGALCHVLHPRIRCVAQYRTVPAALREWPPAASAAKLPASFPSRPFTRRTTPAPAETGVPPHTRLAAADRRGSGLNDGRGRVCRRPWVAGRRVRWRGGGPAARGGGWRAGGCGGGWRAGGCGGGWRAGGCGGGHPGAVGICPGPVRSPTPDAPDAPDPKRAYLDKLPASS